MTGWDRSDSSTDEWWDTCENDDVGFCFRFPAGWVQAPDVLTMLLHPEGARSFVTSGGRTVFNPAIELTVSQPGNPSGGVSVLRAIAGFPDLFPEYRRVSDSLFSLVTRQPALELVFEFEAAGQSFRSICVLAVTPEFLFKFEATSRKDDLVRHENWLCQCVRSLEIRA